MQYQTFVETKGASDSFAKLSALRLPSLENLRVLDVGCNEGFFCGYSLFDGAQSVTGIDSSATAIEKAKRRFPECNFIRQDWSVLPEGPYDVILMLSALHYADNQENMIERLLSALSDEGVLVLEIGIAPGPKISWEKIERSIDTRYFPTRKMLEKVLKDFAWKIVGKSVGQSGDPVPRYVVHVRKMKPYVVLLMQNPGMGKSTIGRKLFAQNNMSVLSGDTLYNRIYRGRQKAPEALARIVKDRYTTTGLDKVARRILEAGMADDLVELWVSVQHGKEFVLDSYIPEEFRKDIIDSFARHGYFPICMDWSNEHALSAVTDAAERAANYETSLLTPIASENQVNRIRLIPLSEPKECSLYWHLDSPTNDEILVPKYKYILSGWLYVKDASPSDVTIYVESQSFRKETSLSKTRRDVLAFLQEDKKEHVDSPWSEGKMGFALQVSSEMFMSSMTIGVIVGSNKIPLAIAQVSSIESGLKARLKHKFFGKVKK
ncbi:methyltransferase domain-containing protein [Carnimonas bestiolae]|uniref:methyltransferase domain-containing protein n=1 Tax=Carnimonas bestiolae TaxID=3402172 RepID=UPI003EDC6AB6